MLNIDEIQNGIVIDHIKAGTAVGLMDLLGIAGNRTASVALIQNARSKKTASGRKDIIKVEGDASWLNLDVLAYLDPNISVTIIENGKAVRKEQPKPPKRLVNIVRCKNPRFFLPKGLFVASIGEKKIAMPIRAAVVRIRKR